MLGEKLSQSIWSNFTKQYPISKTLRFELKPIGKTAEWLEKNNIFKKDLNIDKSYKQAKFYFDKLHQDFIREALSLENDVRELGFEEFAKVYEENNQKIKSLKKEKNLKKDKQKNDFQKQIIEQREKLYKKITDLFNKKAESWKEEYQNKEIEENGEIKKIKFSKSALKQKGVNFLTSAGIVNILKYKFPKEKEKEFLKNNWPSLFIEDELNSGEKIYIFDSFDKFTTYLGRFQKTRENLYKDDGTSTAVATRIVSNFERFLNNRFLFKEKYAEKSKNIGFNQEQLEIFEIDYYFNCLIQEGIDKYNKLIGEINKKAKEYRDRNKIDKADLPLFLNLEKQILGEIEKQRKLIEARDGKSEEEIFVDVFQEFIQQNHIRIFGGKKNEEEFEGIKKLVEDFTNDAFKEEYQNIYLKKNVINEIVHKWFSNPLEFLMKLSGSKSEEKINLKKYISLEDFKNTILNFEGEIFKSKFYQDENNLESQPPLIHEENPDNWKNFLKIWQFEFNSLFKDKFEKDSNGEIKKDKNGNPIQIFWGYTDKLEKEAHQLQFYSGKKEQIKIIKNYCDAALGINRMVRYFNLSDKDRKDIPSNLSTEFYGRLDEYFKDFPFGRYYDEIRNFVTKKPSNSNKIKLNFESGSLLTGFDKNKESEKLGVIFRDKNKYYLGIINNINKSYKTIFDKDKYPEIYKPKESSWEKMELKILPTPTRMISKIAFGEKNLKEFGCTKEIKEIKNEYEKYQKRKLKEKNFALPFDKNKLAKLIKYYQDCLEKNGYKEIFNFSWKSPGEYNSMSEFNNDIERKSYKLRFVKIDENYIKKNVEEGKLYLFEIYNKDFNPNSKGNKNIHTLYFLNLFSDKNIDLETPIIRLGANAEIFYRQPVVERIIEKRGVHKEKEIIKYKRYTQEKILFHFPIKINAAMGKVPKNRTFNINVNKFLKENIDKINIIGIDRGEKNLLYYCVINQNQEILDYGSFNEINGVNHFNKLVEREKQRMIERQSWEPVRQIKDLKQGFLSYVIRKVCDLIIQYNAIVILEDLNRRFKQIRGGIERTIYQQFEKALINKLNYLVFKDNRDVFSPGGILNGFQLTAPFANFREIEYNKQTGILFYTDASYTSQTDPLTGFRRNIYISNSTSQKEIINLINKLKGFGWDKEKESYFFIYNAIDFKNKNEKEVIDKDWVIYTKVPRILRYKDTQGYYTYKKIDLNEEFSDLLNKYGFKQKESNILEEIKLRIKEGDKNLSEKKKFDGKQKNFYERFIFLFNLVLQARNTYSLSVKIDKFENRIKEVNYGVDFFASPVEPFFTTYGLNEVSVEKNGILEKEKKEILTNENLAEFKKRFKKYDSNIKFDSDGVGAYNIARKGLIILERIKENSENPDFFISRLNWDNFVINNY